MNSSISIKVSAIITLTTPQPLIMSDGQLSDLQSKISQAMADASVEILPQDSTADVDVRLFRGNQLIKDKIDELVGSGEIELMMGNLLMSKIKGGRKNTNNPISVWLKKNSDYDYVSASPVEIVAKNEFRNETVKISCPRLISVFLTDFFDGKYPLFDSLDEIEDAEVEVIEDVPAATRVETAREVVEQPPVRASSSKSIFQLEPNPLLVPPGLNNLV